MPALVLVGAQWGDEGKGKVTDYLAQEADLIVRYQGGANAGHTVVFDNEEFKLHLIPSGIFHPTKICVIGNGVVIDPESLIAELATLEKKGILVANLRISRAAHVIMPYHKLLDVCEENQRGEHKLGTTKRGIGPAYVDKVSRCGIRIGDLLEPEVFQEKLRQNLAAKNLIFEKIFNLPPLREAEIFSLCQAYGQKIKPFVTDTTALINKALREGKKVIFEGAQGTFLDLDHGTYPYVTSSATVAGGACVGAGVGPTFINKVIGVAKAYTTRVGEGPFPTEIKDEIGVQIRERGKEYGTTTGRPRRCGWFDAVMIQHAARVNGLHSLALTKLDVLDPLPVVKICAAYRYQGKKITSFPSNLKVLRECEPIYEEWEGWQEELSGITDFEALPPAAKKYLFRLETLTGLKVSLVAVGPRREQTIPREPIF